MGIQNFAWSVFACVVVALLIFDLGVFNRKDEVITLKKSMYLSFFYITISCLFGLFVFNEFGSGSASEYYTGFLLEKTMSLDNIFMISMIFKFFKIPQQYQHRVLFWGILGVIILRAVIRHLDFMFFLLIFPITMVFCIQKRSLRKENTEQLRVRRHSKLPPF